MDTAVIRTKVDSVVVSERDVARKGERREFVEAAWALLGDEDNWTPPMISEELEQIDPARNPFLAGGHVRLFVATRGRLVVGRIAYLEGPYLVAGFEQGVGCFGYFACRRDLEAAVALLERVTAYARSRGRSMLLGPFSPTLYDYPGILEEGFDARATLLTSFNPPWYRDFFEAAAFSRFKELLAFEVEVTEELPEGLLRAEQLALRCGIEIRHPDFGSFSRELQKFFEVHWGAINANWGEVEFTNEQREYLAQHMRPLLRKELVAFAYYRNQPVGIALAIPDGVEALKTLNGRLGPIRAAVAMYQLYRTHSTRLPLIGVLPEHRRRGIDGALIADLWRAGYRRGIRRCDISWVLADNHRMVNTINRIGAAPRRRWWIYSKAL
jgi:GNAT superfamily N-acetyltransferase